MAYKSKAFDGSPKKKVIPKPAPRIPRPVIPKERRPTLRPTGPRPFVKGPEQLDTPGPPPNNLTVTLPEWYVHWWLTKRHHRFEFQSSLLGGRVELGGLVTDFIVSDVVDDPGLVINVQGYVWHRFSTDLRARDLLTKVRLQGLGFTVVYVMEDDVLKRLDYVMENAIRLKQIYSDTI